MWIKCVPIVWIEATSLSGLTFPIFANFVQIHENMPSQKFQRRPIHENQYSWKN